MPTLTITLSIDVPDGTTVQIKTDSAELDQPEPFDSQQVLDYWTNYLSDNGRKLYRQAAATEEFKDGPFTLNDLATALSIDYASVQSFHRNSGRTARRWREEYGAEAPIRLVEVNYKWDPEEEGMRTRYRLPRGVADLIRTLS